MPRMWALRWPAISSAGSALSGPLILYSSHSGRLAKVLSGLQCAQHLVDFRLKYPVVRGHPATNHLPAQARTPYIQTIRVRCVAAWRHCSAGSRARPDAPGSSRRPRPCAARPRSPKPWIGEPAFASSPRVTAARTVSTSGAARTCGARRAYDTPSGSTAVSDRTMDFRHGLGAVWSRSMRSVSSWPLRSFNRCSFSIAPPRRRQLRHSPV
jgi:hypothetical protein